MFFFSIKMINIFIFQKLYMSVKWCTFMLHKTNNMPLNHMLIYISRKSIYQHSIWTHITEKVFNYSTVYTLSDKYIIDVYINTIRLLLWTLSSHTQINVCTINHNKINTLITTLNANINIITLNFKYNLSVWKCLFCERTFKRCYFEQTHKIRRIIRSTLGIV